MVWTIEFSKTAGKEFDRLDHAIQARIRRYMKERIAPDPKRFGEALAGDKKGLWRYRVGDYRIVTSIEQEKLVVIIVRVGHRKHVYH